MIRNYRRGDESAIAELEAACFSSPWSEAAVLSSHNEGIRFFIYEKDGKTVGYVGLQRVLDEGYITNIAVSPDCRRQGIAKALLSELDRLAESLSLSFISLEVRGSNSAAISLYTALGYKREGIRRGFYDNPKEDAIIMTKRRDAAC